MENREQEFELTSDDPAVAEAFRLYAAGDLKGAIRTAEGTLPQTTDPVSMRLVLALARKRSGLQRRAVEELSAALESDPGRADVWTVLGMCRRDLGETEQAADDFRCALKADAGYAKAKFQLAVATQELGRFEESTTYFRDYVSREPGASHALAWSLLGLGLRRLRRFDESAAAIERAIELVPDDIPTRNALVITYHEAGHDKAALAVAREVLEMKDALATRQAAEMNLGLSLQEREAPFDASDRAKNIISFSLWGDDPVYTHGAIVNAQIAPHVYAGWRCRFYCDDTVPLPIRDELTRLGSEVHLVRGKKLRQLRPLWRFLVSDDPGVERFICRDADSRLNTQEAVAVDDWIRSGLPFHVMRDHVYHMEVMLAGMWGGVTRVLPNIRELADVALGYRRNKWNDQEFLRDVVWPLIRDRTKAHDSLFRFRGADDFPSACRLPGLIHVGGAVKKMPPWPVPGWPSVPSTDSSPDSGGQ